jgi:hypothetical protein
VSTNVVAQAACDYIGAGFSPIPIPPRSKNPRRDDWQHEHWTLADVPAQFSESANIGLLLGIANGGLVNLDLDCPEAVALAPSLAPVTGFKSGHAGNPHSCYWYKGDPVPTHRSYEFAGEKLVELRSVGQTIVPPSIHPDGDQYIWHEADGEPPTIAGAELSRVARELAAATLLLRCYPKPGMRHDFALALAGFLLRQSGWDAARTKNFVCAVASSAGDDEIKDRESAVETTSERLATDAKALGGTRFREIVGNAVFDTFCDWMGFAKGAPRANALPLIEAETVADEALEPWPSTTLEGDFIGDLMHVLTDGTALPPHFAREQIILTVGALADEHLGYPSHPDLIGRRYLGLISERPQAGKGETWKRVAGKDSALRFYLDTASVKVQDGGGIGSGQFLARILQETPRLIAAWDETSELFQQTGQQSSTILSALKKLYESTSHWSGSFTNKKFGTDDAHLSVLLHSTRKTFVQGFSVRGGIGDGLLSRFVFGYSNTWPVVPEWSQRDYAREQTLAEKIIALIPTTRTAPGIDAAARKRMAEFAHEMNGSEQEHPEHTPRLLEHAKVDVLMRCFFSGAQTISLEMVERSIAWARYQLKLRLEFWPPDARDAVAAIIQIILRRLRKGSASARDLRKAANVNRDGTHEPFNRALSALTRSGQVTIAGKNRVGQNVYQLEFDDVKDLKGENQ